MVVSDNKLYENKNGKIRIASKEGEKESSVRREWFSQISERVIEEMGLDQDEIKFKL